MPKTTEVLRKENANTAKVTDAVKPHASVKANVKPEVAPEQTAPRSWREALANVLIEVPKSAQKLVTDATNFLVNSIRTSAHNSLAIGEQLAKVQASISEASFSRMIAEVWIRCTGVSRATIYRWIKQSAVIADAIKYDVAREAFLVVNGNKPLFATNDGITTLTGPYVAAFRKYPAPTEGTYDDCLDWSREVLIMAERGQDKKSKSNADLIKQIRGSMTRLLEGGRGYTANHKDAIEGVLECCYLIRAKSEPLYHAIYTGMEEIENGVAIAPAAKTAFDAAMAEQKARDTAARESKHAAAKQTA